MTAVTPAAKAAYKAANYARRILVDGRWVAPVERHGTWNAYDYHGCRCVPCTAAACVRSAENRARRRHNLAVDAAMRGSS